VSSHSPIELRVPPDLVDELGAQAAGRVLYVDHFPSRRCGVTIGDLRIRWLDRPADDAVTLESIGPVPVTAEADILGVLASGAAIARRAFGRGPRLAIRLDVPETWLDYLDRHPTARR